MLTRGVIMNEMDPEIRKIFIELKEQILALPYTERRNKFVEHVDCALDAERNGENFVDVFLKLEKSVNRKSEPVAA